MVMKDLLGLFIEEMRNFRSDVREDMDSLRAVNQSILKFMGESTEDRKGLHRVVKHHDKRITELEKLKKKEVLFPIRFSGF